MRTSSSLAALLALPLLLLLLAPCLSSAETEAEAETAPVNSIEDLTEDEEEVEEVSSLTFQAAATAASSSTAGRCIPAEAGMEPSEAKYFYYGEHPVPLSIFSTSRVTHQVGAE